MKRTDIIPCVRHLLSLPQKRNRNCEEPVKGQARWRGSLRSPLTEPSQFQSNPSAMEAKEEKQNIAINPPVGVTESAMNSQSQPADLEHASSESVTENRFYTEYPKWLNAAEAAQYLNIKARTILLWARQGRVRAYALTGTKRHVWRFLHADLEAMVTQGRPVVSSAQPSVLVNERSI